MKEKILFVMFGIAIGLLTAMIIVKTQRTKCVLIEGLSNPLPVGVYNTTVLDLDKMYKSGGVK